MYSYYAFDAQLVSGPGFLEWCGVMEELALRKARNRLRAAENAFEQMRATKIGSPDFDHGWYAFLVAQNSFFSALEQGSKRGASKGWIDKIKNERKNDALLCYLQQARHSDEHSLRPTVVKTQRNIQVNQPHTAAIDPATGKPNLKLIIGEEVNARFAPSAETLLSVTNRGRTYDPPKTHMGQPLETTYPMKIADLCIQYLRRVLTEAENLV